MRSFGSWITSIPPSLLIGSRAAGYSQTGVGEGYSFGEIDVARVELILELRRLDIDDDTIPLVLGLLEQMYTLGRRIRLLQDVIMAQAPQVQRSILDAVAGHDGS